MPTTTVVGPWDLLDALPDQIAAATEAWSYCTFPSAKFKGRITMLFVDNANMPLVPGSTTNAYGYTYSNTRTVKINTSLSPAEMRYTMIHETGHMADADLMSGDAVSHGRIMAKMTPDFGYANWKDPSAGSGYKYRASECFAHAFAKGLYTSTGYTWQNVLNTTYKRTIAPADYAYVRTEVENGIQTGNEEFIDVPSGETRTVLASKDASVIVNEGWVANDTGSGGFKSGGTATSIEDGFNGADQHHPLGHLRGSGWEYYSRAFLYFPISFTGAQTVDDALLWIKQRPRGSGHAWAAGGGSVTIYIRRMTKDFAETPKNAEAVWKQSSNNSTTFKKTAQRYSSADNSENWTLEHAVTKTFTQVDNGWVPIDVTAIVQDWFAHSTGLRTNAPNYGFIIMAAVENDVTQGIDFFSREATDTTAIPYMEVTINANVAPAAPVNLAPTANALQNTLLPVFTGSNSDPDAGDYITAVQVKAFKNDGTTLLWDSGSIPVTGHPTTFSVTYGQQPGITPPVALTGNASYKWQARTADKAGAWSTAWSALQQFKVNTPPQAPSVALVESPTTDIKTSTPTVSITHNDPDPGDSLMYGYKIQVLYANTVIYNGPAVDLASIDRATTKQITLPTLAPPDGNPWGKSYQVKAQTKDSNGSWGVFSALLDFTTHKTGVPVNLNPTGNNITPTSVPTFTGERASTTDLLTSFQIALYDDSLTQIWSSGVLTAGSNAAFSQAYPGTLSSGTFYQWKAMVTSSVGGDSDWSALQRFQTPSDVTVPTPTAPLNQGISGGTGGSRPTFTGSRATTYNRFQIEVYPNSANIGNLASYASGSSVDSTHYWASGTRQNAVGGSTITGSGPYLFGLGTDVVPSLGWGTSYKWRARVSSDAGSTWSGWSGLTPFTMDVALTPTLTTPVSNAWITTAAPTFRITAGGTDIIDKVRIKVFASNGTSLIWDTNPDNSLTDVTNSSAGGFIDYVYAGPTLTGGYYWWQAQYQKSTGPVSVFASSQRFRLNFAPDIPTSLAPPPGQVIPETLTIPFEARFSDQDVTPMGDVPTEWEIVVEQVTPNSVKATISITTGLVVGVNHVDYDGTSTLAYNVDFQWKTRFKDSKGIWGNYSAYRTFRPSIKPNSTTIDPSNTSNVNTLQPTVTWTYVDMSGSSQKSVAAVVYEVQSESDKAVPPGRLTGVDDEVLVYVTKVTKQQTGNSFTFPAGIFQDDKVYQIELTVTNQDGLEDPTPQIARWYFDLDAPDPVRGLSPTSNVDLSRIELRWDAPTALKTGHTFVAYNVYKKLLDDTIWQYVDSLYELNPVAEDDPGPVLFDYYAGVDIMYEYRVTIVTTKTGQAYELESGDDPNGGNTCEAILESDVWMFVGADRAPTHILELPVLDEDHNRVVQQEQFEPLGAARKVIIRGFVLGHEGSIQMLFENVEVQSPVDYQLTVNETILGRRLLDYLTNNKGPHILKSPFGDVWDAQFEGPEYKWTAVGHLQVTLNWVETGVTSQVSI